MALTDLDTTDLDTGRPAVCRQYGCPSRATTADLCPVHQAAQDRLRERADQNPPHPHVNLPSLSASRPTWHKDAACRGQGPDAYYPGANVPHGVAGDAYARARQLCHGCPVAVPCAEAGQREHHGMWGGQSPGQRRPRHQVA